MHEQTKPSGKLLINQTGPALCALIHIRPVGRPVATYPAVFLFLKDPLGTVSVHTLRFVEQQKIPKIKSSRNMPRNWPIPVNINLLEIMFN